MTMMMMIMIIIIIIIVIEIDDDDDDDDDRAIASEKHVCATTRTRRASVVTRPFRVVFEVSLVESPLSSKHVEVKTSPLTGFDELREKKRMSFACVPLCGTLTVPGLGAGGDLAHRACEKSEPGAIAER